MPTYQYVCTNADDKHEFEVVQSFSDPSLTECPQCGSPVRKVYGSIGVVFKGSGFYRTDSRAAEPSPASASSEKSGADKSESSGSGKDPGSTPPAKPSSSSGSSSSSSSSSTSSSSSSAPTKAAS